MREASWELHRAKFVVEFHIYKTFICEALFELPHRSAQNISAGKRLSLQFD
jgi:hypothetical protein